MSTYEPADDAIIVVNTETVPGYRIRHVCGLVQGNTVRAKHVGRDIMAALKNIVGGELVGYTELLTESREEAVGRMLWQAAELGANAVVNVRFATSSITDRAAELYCYGTAVFLDPIEPAAPARAVVTQPAAVPQPPAPSPVAPVAPPVSTTPASPAAPSPAAPVAPVPPAPTKPPGSGLPPVAPPPRIAPPPPAAPPPPPQPPSR